MSKNIENTEKTLGMAERVLGLIKKHSFWDWIKSILVLFMIGAAGYALAKPETIIEYFQEALNAKHLELMEYRQKNAAKVQAISDKLIYTYGATRCVVLELHNSVTSATGLPFLKASCSFEGLNEMTFPVSEQYQSTTLSLMPFADYLFKHNIWYGNTADMEKIDRSLSYRMRANGTEWFIARTIRTSDGTVGFLFLSFDLEPEDDIEKLKNDVDRAAWDMALLLEMKP